MGGNLEKNNKIRHVLPVLFDIRPVNTEGNFDLKKIQKIGSIVDLRNADIKKKKEDSQEVKIEKSQSILKETQAPIEKEQIEEIQIEDDSVLFEEPQIEDAQISFEDPQRNLTREELLEELEKIEESDRILKKDRLPFNIQEVFEEDISEEIPEEIPSEIVPEEIKSSELNNNLLEEFYFPEVASEKYSGPSLRNFKKFPSFYKRIPKSLVSFLSIGILIALIVPAVSLISHGIGIKEEVLSSSLSAYQNLLAAQNSLEQADWQTAEQSFNSARLNFNDAGQEVKKLGSITLGILDNLPGDSLVSSGNHLIKVGENLAQAGQTLTSAINLFSFNNLFNLFDSDDPKGNVLASKRKGNLTDNIALSKEDIIVALQSIKIADEELENVKIESLPSEIQEGVSSLKEKLPLVEEMLNQALNYSDALLNILGHSNPRQYLLIFQNNSEIRATGGFIGTYGLLTLDRGLMSDLFVDGIYNADGQLHEKIIPPRPIQKISTSWSMHDANWFADFPTSAEKIEWFYEKTGGPTVDGVISLTPTIIERLLELTGPISMPNYDVVLDKDNFVELIQYKVEIDYDKDLNRPKKILADFAPEFIKALGSLSLEKRKKAVNIFFDCLEEKHILAYFNDTSLQKLSVDEGWSGEITETDKDYLSVVSSNINGYKTDRMVEETISHQAEIQEDGSIIDTLTIKREHKGGNSSYDWWNRVNSNYLRVYLPLGSELISATGQSLEIYQPPIDYQKHNFKNDPTVEKIESEMIIDKKTGTRIFKESNKTVFGNWVYVSPGEVVVLTYKYKLPFKIDLTKPIDSYSLLTQKQLGSIESKFTHQLKYPQAWNVSWRHPDDFNLTSGKIELNSNLRTDRFLGVTFEF